MAPTPQMLALASACFSAVSTTLIQKGLRRSNFYAGFWINVVVGMLGLWTVVLLVVPRTEYHWRAVPYFILSGVVGTAGGRLFRVVAIEKVGPCRASAAVDQPGTSGVEFHVGPITRHGGSACVVSL